MYIVYIYKINIILSVVTKTGNTRNDRKPPANDPKPPQVTTNHQHKTTNYQKTNANYLQTTTNGHLCTSNQKPDIYFLLPASSNYKERLDFGKHTLQCQISVVVVPNS